MSALLEVREIRKQFARSEQAALEDVGFDLQDGELLTLMGASGSGKTTLLRILAGLENADSGKVLLGGETLTSGGQIVVPSEQRRMGFVFQNHALFPHLTVSENVCFGLQKSGRAERAAEMLDRVSLAELGKRYPHELSGGERQRVALARALAPGPDLLLMDEPFSSLDPALRRQLRDETRRLLLGQKTSTILVTHDAEDALAISDRIVVLRGGTVQQVGTPEQIFRRPANRYVATSFGPCNFLKRAVFPDARQLAEYRGIEPDEQAGEEIWLRPADLDLVPSGHPEALLDGNVVDNQFQGEDRLLTLSCTSSDGSELMVRAQVATEAIAPSYGVRVKRGPQSR